MGPSVIESMVERDVTLVQTGLRASASSSGPGPRPSNTLEKWIHATHWAVDISNREDDLITRFELRNNGDGTSSVIVSRNITATGDYKPHVIGSKAKTWLTDDIIEERATKILLVNSSYKLLMNDCQTFAVLLMDEISFEKSWWTSLNAWQFKILRGLTGA